MISHAIAFQANGKTILMDSLLRSVHWGHVSEDIPRHQYNEILFSWVVSCVFISRSFPKKSENVSSERLFLREKQGWLACCLPLLGKLLLPCLSYQAQHQPADVASADNLTGLPVGLALARLHHGIVLGVFRVTRPTPLQVALRGPWKEFFLSMISMQQCAGLFLVVLGRLACGRTKPANLLPEDSCKLLSLSAFLSWKQQVLSLLVFLLSLSRR